MTEGGGCQAAGAPEVGWRDWGSEAFDEAAKTGKLVLLDLTATWCHWCHVMDGTTYSDREVVSTINREFVPVRVDIDRRPDISERYNRGGFPTTAFLSSRGESVWGATYIPPADMKRIMEAVLRAKRSGEIGSALEKARRPRPSGRRPLRTAGIPSEAELDRLFAAMLDAYDSEHGGFGLEPKFPHPDAVDLMLARHARAPDHFLAGAVTRTLSRMAEGLYDKVEGGVFRYSVARDWSVPHYEKMLETNLGIMRNLARAHVALGTESFHEWSGGIASYLLRNLRDQVTGGFHGSQDADEEYYRLPASGRSRRRPPSVDRTMYSGWNALASSAFTEAGVLLGREDWVATGQSALDYVLRDLLDHGSGLARHAAGQDLYLFEDQAEVLSAMVESLGVRGVASVEEAAMRLVDGVRRSFTHTDGGFGDVMPGEGPGDLGTPIRSLVANSKWAHGLALLGAATDRRELTDEAGSVIGSFDGRTVAAHGVFGSSYLTAADVLRDGPVKVEVHSTGGMSARNPFLAAAKGALDPGAVTVSVMDSEDFAVVCSKQGCSAKLRDPSELVRALRLCWTGQL